MEKDIESIYQNLLLGDLGKLEIERKAFVKSYRKIVWSVIGLVAAWVLIFFLLEISSLVVLFVVLAAIIIASGIWLGVKYSRFYKPFRAEFKLKVVPALVKCVDERLSYDASRGLMNEYWDSKLFPQRLDRERAEDTIAAQFDSTRFSFGEIHTEYKTTSTDSKGNRQEHWHTVFQGLFFAGDFNKNFSGETILDQDKMERMFGKLGRKFQSWNGQRAGQLIRMDNPEFEKKFAIYSTDEQECRYILTPSLMERILELNRRTQGQICISFRNSNVYVAYTFAEDLFEPLVFKPALKQEDAKLLVHLINLMSGIVEDLNLNTRIWSKV